MMWIIFVVGNICIQTDWVSGPGVLGPVTNWGKSFHQADSMTYNIQGQISPVSSTVDYTKWTKHIIDSDGNICNNSIVAADFNGDGSLDLAGWIGNSNTLQFYKNDGSNNFSKTNSYSGPQSGSWSFIATADFNNDNKPDVVVPSVDDYLGLWGGLMWFENKGNFNFTSHSISSTPYVSVETGDIDNNGTIDIIAGKGPTSGVDIWKNDGSGNFTQGQSFSVTSWRLVLSDLNNDGWKDLVIGDGYSGKIYIYLNDGTGSFPSSPSATLDASNVDGLGCRDVDNDGFKDIIFGAGDGLSYFNLYWYRNLGDGINYEKHTVYAQNNMNYADGATTEDFDMDGKADIVSSFQKLAFFRQVTLDSFTEYPIDSFGTNYSHWVIPMKLNQGTCVKSGSVDLLVCYEGNFAWYTNLIASKFAANSYLESSILNSQCVDSANWAYFGYDVCTPSANALSFQFRTGNTSGAVTSAAWSNPVSVPAGTLRDSISLALTPAKLFQYRINCKGTTDAPVVYEVWVNYTCADAGVNEKHLFSPASLQIQNNEICYSLQAKANIAISLYDITGRTAKTIESREQEAGTYKVKVSNLKAGVYFVAFSNNGVKTTRKMVIIK